MAEIPLAKDIIIICGMALIVITVCSRIGIPSIVGFLVTGVVAGPNGLGLIGQTADVHHLAEIGVVCLLFTIGLEFSISHLMSIKKIAFVGGGLQVFGTILIVVAIGMLGGRQINQSVFFGLLLSLSSTAIVLKIQQQRLETEAPQGRISLGVLLFQDIIVVPFLLFTPMLAGQSSRIDLEVLTLLVKASLLISIVWVMAKWVVPYVFYKIADLNSRESFIIAVVLIVLGMATLSSVLGLSLALGAFLAGIIVAESEYNHRALGTALPFRDFFTSLFFVSIGMLLNIEFVMEHLPALIMLTFVVVLIKLTVTGAAVWGLGFPVRIAILTGLSLGQIGEFSFVLAQAGTAVNLVDPETYQYFVGVSVLTMSITPFLISGGETITSALMKLLPLRLVASRNLPERKTDKELTNHMIIVGYGLNGRHLSLAAEFAKIPCIIVELNPETVRREKADDQPIFYGDASEVPVLEHAGIYNARILVIVISDPSATKRIIDTARRLNPGIHIIARTRFVSEIDPLHELGADEVIPEDYEASVEVLSRVLKNYLVPIDDIENLLEKIRSDSFRMLRQKDFPKTPYFGLQLAESEISSRRVHAGSEAENRSLLELDLRNRYGVNVIAVRRNGNLIENPVGQEVLQADDILILLGRPEKLSEVNRIL